MVWLRMGPRPSIRILVVRIPSVGGAENGVVSSYPPEPCWLRVLAGLVFVTGPSRRLLQSVSSTVVLSSLSWWVSAGKTARVEAAPTASFACRAVNPLVVASLPCPAPY
jgi:hypothetical protein